VSFLCINNEQTTYQTMITASTTQNFHLEPIKLGSEDYNLPFDYSPYKKVSAVRTDFGQLVMYVCGGYNQDGKTYREVHVFYANGNMWSSFGKTVETAVQGAFADIFRQAM
jgi:hypothetical protein